jgi:hypothetical protein
MNITKMHQKIYPDYDSRGSKRLLLFFFTLICIFTTACESDVEQNDEIKTYFDLKGFVENQIVELNDKKPMVTKIAGLGKQRVTNKVNDIDWKKELELFVQADLNKPSYRQSYTIERKDSSTFEYHLKPNVELPVHYLKIMTDTSVHQPIYVKALFESENKIYKSEKSIELTRTQRNNVWELSSYEVHGYQKLIFMDRKDFDIIAKIGL